MGSCGREGRKDGGRPGHQLRHGPRSWKRERRTSKRSKMSRRRKEGKEAKERDQEPELRSRSISAGAASSWKLKRKKKSKEEAAPCTGSKEDLRPEKLLVWSDIDWARKAWN